MVPLRGGLRGADSGRGRHAVLLWCFDAAVEEEAPPLLGRAVITAETGRGRVVLVPFVPLPRAVAARTSLLVALQRLLSMPAAAGMALLLVLFVLSLRTLSELLNAAGDGPSGMAAGGRASARLTCDIRLPTAVIMLDGRDGGRFDDCIGACCW